MKQDKNTANMKILTEMAHDDFLSLNIGDVYKGEKIREIKFVTPKYIIFNTESNPRSIYYYYNDEECSRYIGRIQRELGKLIAVLKINDEYNENYPFLCSICATCLEGDVEEAQEMINNLHNQTVAGQEFRRKGKMNYLLFCLSITLIAILMSVILHYRLLPEYFALVKYVKIATLGSVGGFISIAIKVNSIAYNFDKSTTLQILSATSRIFISIFSAIIIYIFIQSELLLGFLKDIDNMNLYYSFAVLAGFSETFIPDLFKAFEKNTINNIEK